MERGVQYGSTVTYPRLRAWAFFSVANSTCAAAFAQEPADGVVSVPSPPAEGDIPPPATAVAAVERSSPLVLQPEPAPTPPTSTSGAAPAPDDENGVAGWYPGFAIKSHGEQFKLRIGLQAAYRFEPHWLDGKSQDRQTFFVLRPILEGNLFEEWLRFSTSFEFASNPPFLLDSYLEIQKAPEIGVRIGQQYTPLSRHEYVGPQELLFPDWSPVAEYFWSGRDKGVTVLGSLGGGALDYWLGVYSGTPLRQFMAIDGSYVLEARATYNPMGPVATNEAPYITSEQPVPLRASFTLQGYYGNVEGAVETFNSASFRYDTESSGQRRKQSLGSADVWFQSPRCAALVEAYVRRTDPSGQDDAYTSFGIWGQVGVMLADRLVDVGLRGNLLQPSTDVENDLFYSVEGQLGYYPFHTQNLVTKLRYGYGKQQSPSVEAAPLYSAAGVHHLLTLQLGLAL